MGDSGTELKFLIQDQESSPQLPHRWDLETQASKFSLVGPSSLNPSLRSSSGTCTPSAAKEEEEEEGDQHPECVSPKVPETSRWHWLPSNFFFGSTPLTTLNRTPLRAPLFAPGWSRRKSAHRSLRRCL
jgi:hypothetical protein